MTTAMAQGHDIPVRKVVIGLVVVALGVVVYFASIKPAVREHTLEVRATRRAACSAVPEATSSAILAGLGDIGDRRVRSMRAKPSTDGWWMVSADLAEPEVPKGFTGDLVTWRVRDDGGLVIESVDPSAKDLSSFPSAPGSVQVADVGGFDSRWCAKNAALSP